MEKLEKAVAEWQAQQQAMYDMFASAISGTAPIRGPQPHQGVSLPSTSSGGAEGRRVAAVSSTSNRPQQRSNAGRNVGVNYNSLMAASMPNTVTS